MPKNYEENLLAEAKGPEMVEQKDVEARALEQQKKQAFEQVKIQFTAKLKQAVQQQQRAGGAQMDISNIDIERHPQFQEEWRKVQLQLDSQYLKLLDEMKQNKNTTLNTQIKGRKL